MTYLQEFIIQETKVKKKKKRSMKIQSDSEANKKLYNFTILSLCSPTPPCGVEVRPYL